MCYSYTIGHAAACVVNLPLGSSLLARIDPRLQYTIEDFRLHQILESIVGEHINYPWEESAQQGALPALGALPKDEFDAWYAQDFKEVADGGKCW